MIFMNCTQHDLTVQQMNEIKSFLNNNGFSFEGHICNLKDNEKQLFNRLANTPENDEERKNLVVDFADFINKNEDTMFHLPIGSPAFMFELASFLQWKFVSSNGVKTYHICMSHTKRTSIEKDGVKTSVFKFERFIRVE